MPFNHFLPLNIISKILIFSNSCHYQRGNFILFIIQTSVGVDPGSQDDTRIVEAYIGRGHASEEQAYQWKQSCWFILFCREKSGIINLISLWYEKPQIILVEKGSKLPVL